MCIRDSDYDMLSKTLDISAVSFHKMIQAAKKLDAIAEYGSCLLYTSCIIVVLFNTKYHKYAKRVTKI